MSQPCGYGHTPAGAGRSGWACKVLGRACIHSAGLMRMQHGVQAPGPGAPCCGSPAGAAPAPRPPAAPRQGTAALAAGSSDLRRHHGARSGENGREWARGGRLKSTGSASTAVNLTREAGPRQAGTHAPSLPWRNRSLPRRAPSRSRERAARRTCLHRLRPCGDIDIASQVQLVPEHHAIPAATPVCERAGKCLFSHTHRLV